jgi:LacI family transcriptional regulator
VPETYNVAVFIEDSGVYAQSLMRGIAHHQEELAVPWILQVIYRHRYELPAPWLQDWASQGHGAIARIDSHEVEAAFIESKLPVVNVSGALRTPHFPTFTQDPAAAALLAIKAFVERGFRRFAYVGLDSVGWATERGECFEERLSELGLECSRFVVSPHEAKADSLRPRLRAWLKNLPRPLALWACNDEMAQHVINACRSSKFRVPEEIAVLGVNDDVALCELMVPPLASIRGNGEEAGYLAAQRLQSLLTGSPPPKDGHRVLIPPRGVVMRRSLDIHAIADPHVAAALKIIAAEACSGLKVAELAERIPVARRVLERRFKTALNRTLLGEIWRVQCERACRLLETTQLTMMDIAERCGYEHVEHFSTVFKKTVGHSPGHYRKKMQGLL